MKKYYIHIIVTLVLVFCSAVFINKLVIVKAQDNFNTATSIINSAPSITTGPAESTASTTTSPTNAGSNVVITATATDSNNNDYYLAICKTDAITVGNDTVPTCDGGAWDVSSVTSSGSQATATYTTQTSDAESNAWYAFACDKLPSSSGPACSSSSQGTGDSGSPFYVNHQSTFGTVTVTDNSNGIIEPGDTLRFTLPNAQIADSDTNPSQDTINMYICSDATTAFDYSTNTCTNGTLICSDTAVNPTTTDASCDETGNTLVPIPTAHGSDNIKVYVEDNHDFASSGTNQQSYTVSDVEPYVLNSSDFTLNSPVTLTAGTTTSYHFTTLIRDDNGDNDLLTTNVSAVIYDADRVELTNGLCSSDQNDCYNDSSCTISNNDSGTDNTATAQCDFDISFNANASSNWVAHINPKDGNTTSENELSSSPFTVNALLSNNILESSISYGSVSLGSVSADKVIHIQNTGNTKLDVLLSGTDMSCDTPASCSGQVLESSQQKWHIVDNDFTWSDGESGDGPYILDTSSSSSGGASGCVNLDAVNRFNNTSTDTDLTLNFKIKLNSTEYSGDYSGTNTFTATSNCDAEVCDNSIDDDGDGRIDCADHHDCDLSPSCSILDIPMNSDNINSKTEILTDGDFNNWESSSNLTSWGEFASGTSTVNKESKEKYNGNYAVRLDIDSNDSNVFIYQDNAVTIGKKYKFTAYMKSSENSSFNAMINYRGSTFHSFAHPTLTDEYQKFEYTFIPVESGRLEIGRLSGAGGANHSIYVDSVSLVAINEIVDADMEASGTDNWTSSNSTLSKETNNPHGGSRLLRITSINTNIPLAYQNSLVNGRKYRVTGWAKGDGTLMPELTLGGLVFQGSTSTSWQKINVVGTASSVNMALRANTGSNSNYVEFDDIKVEEFDGPLDLSNSYNAILGDGDTSTTFPTELAKGAYDFDGESDYLTIKDNNDLDITGAFTISAWIKPDDFDTDYQRILSKENTGGAYAIGTRSNGAVYAYLNSTSFSGSAGDLTSGIWQHMLITYDQSNVTIYVDGVQKLQSPYTSAIETNDLDLIIGARPIGSLYFDGSVSDLRIFDYAFDSRQVQNLYLNNISVYK